MTHGQAVYLRERLCNDLVLNHLISVLGQELNPDQIFTKDELKKWALENGFVLLKDNQRVFTLKT